MTTPDQLAVFFKSSFADILNAAVVTIYFPCASNYLLAFGVSTRSLI